MNKEENARSSGNLLESNEEEKILPKEHEGKVTKAKKPHPYMDTGRSIYD